FQYIGVADIHGRLMRAADERRSPRKEIASFDGNGPARGLLAADRDGVAPEYLARGGVAEPGPEHSMGGGDLQVPAGRAVDAAELLDDAERRHRIDFEPAERFRPPEPIKTRFSHRCRRRRGQPAIAL